MRPPKKRDATGMIPTGRAAAVHGYRAFRYLSADGINWNMSHPSRQLFASWRLALLRVCPELTVLASPVGKNPLKLHTVYVPMRGAARVNLNRESGEYLATELAKAVDWSVMIATAKRLGTVPPKLDKRTLSDLRVPWLIALQRETRNWTQWPKTGLRSPKEAKSVDPLELKRARRKVTLYERAVKRAQRKLKIWQDTVTALEKNTQGNPANKPKGTQ